MRLKEYDYSQPGEYFVTVCTKDRKHLFGEMSAEEMMENEFGRIVRRCWHELPDHYPHIGLDAFVVMPNHVHGIICILEGPVGAIHESPLPRNVVERRRMLLSKIIGRFKMNTAKQINATRKTPGLSVWQRGFYEHIIRNDKSLDRIRDYIMANPLQWQQDKENTARISKDAFDVWLIDEGKKSPQIRKADEQ
jgi:putative transposase